MAKLFLGWLLMPAAIWASMDIRSSSAVSSIDSVLTRARQAYVCFEAFVFVGASILLVEGLIGLVDFAVMWARERKSSQPSKASEG